MPPFPRVWILVVLCMPAGGCWSKAPALPDSSKPAPRQPASPDASDNSSPVTTAKTIYVPVEEDFRPSYDSDKINQKKQTWNDYWYWVTIYYGGNFWDQGWKKHTHQALEGVRSEETRDELRAQLNDVGLHIAREWSKDNGVRKINTSDLSALGSRLRAAKAKDKGDGSAVRAEITAIRSEIEAKIGR